MLKKKYYLNDLKIPVPDGRSRFSRLALTAGGDDHDSASMRPRSRLCSPCSRLTPLSMDPAAGSTMLTPGSAVNVSGVVPIASGDDSVLLVIGRIS
jgi:hypothetical protein